MTAFPPAVRSGVALLLLSCGVSSAAAQTPISKPLNNFTIADEVQLGREAADVVRDRLPRLEDADVTRFASEMGRRLSDSIPAGLRQTSFHTGGVEVLNVRDVTSFSLPGGPVFISARMIELAGNEDALAGLLAHELAHVVLRHATTQVSASEDYQIGAISGQQVGLSMAAPRPGILERGANFSIASYFFRFGAVSEEEAGRLGERLAEAAGYAPDGLRAMVAALRSEGAAEGGLAWLGRHPTLRSDDTGALRQASSVFQGIQDRVRAIPRPKRSIGNPHHHQAEMPVETSGFSVPAPAGEDRAVTAGDNLQLMVPANWSRLLSGNTVIFAPEGAFVALRDGPAAVTHGIQIGIARSKSEGVEGNTPGLLTALAHNNPRLTWTPAYTESRVAGRAAVSTTMSHVSPVTGDFETVTMTAVHLSDESFLYFLGVAPQMESSTYRGVFDRVIESLRVLE